MRRLSTPVSTVMQKQMKPQKALWAQLVLDWKEIAGNHAHNTRPLKLTFPRKNKGGKLTLGVWGAAALEASYQTPHLIHRVNQYAGFRAIQTIHYQQIAAPFTHTAPVQRERILTPQDQKWLKTLLPGDHTHDETLEAALLAFGKSLCLQTNT